MITISYQRCGNATFSLRLRFYQEGETRYISVNKLLKGDIQKKHWNAKKQQFIPSCPFSEENNEAIQKFKKRYSDAAMDWTGSLYGFFASLEEKTVRKGTPTVSEFIMQQADLVNQRKHADGSCKGTYDNYVKLDKRLRDFSKYKKINYDKLLISELSPVFVDSLFQWVTNIRKGKGKGYISKDLHVMINLAGKEDYLNPDDFKKCDWFKKSKASAQKYNTLSEEQIENFLKIDPIVETRTRRARLFKDVCLMMLYTGQSACDALTTKPSQIQTIHGVKHIVFHRRKLEGRQVVPCAVPVGAELEKILHYWSKRGKDGYIFPLRRNNVPTTKETLKGDIIAITKHMNLWLKKVGKMINCSFPLHTYTFRHTAITRYVSKNIPVVYLSNMFGTSVDNIEKIYYNNLGDISSRNKVLEAMSI